MEAKTQVWSLETEVNRMKRALETMFIEAVEKYHEAIAENGWSATASDYFSRAYKTGFAFGYSPEEIEEKLQNKMEAVKNEIA